MIEATPMQTPDRSEGDVWYFAYGSNLLRDQKEKRTGRIREPRVVRLPGYRLAFNKRASKPGEVYANIVPESGVETWGVAYRCNPEALMEMDDCEGVRAGHYVRRSIEVVTRSEEILEAETYVAAPDHVCDERMPSAEYLDRIVRGAREHGLPEDYVRWVESHGAKGLNVGGDFAILGSSVVALANTVPWQTDKRASDATGLLFKLYNHVSSAFYIAPGIHSPTSTDWQYDFPSVFVLCRAAFETFLRFYHVFVQPASQEERDCRHYGWMLASLLRRQRYPGKLVDSKKILAHDRNVIQELEKRLTTNPCYQGLPPNQRDRLRRDGQLYGWTRIARDAGQDDWHAEHSYDYLCGHAHSGAASVLQICQAGPEKSKEMISTGLQLCLVSMAFMLDAFTRVYPQGRSALSAQQLRAIEKWKHLGSGARDDPQQDERDE